MPIPRSFHNSGIAEFEIGRRVRPTCGRKVDHGAQPRMSVWAPGRPCDVPKSCDVTGGQYNPPVSQ